MNLYQLNGLTPQQLHLLIMESPVGFSAEGGSIQYLAGDTTARWITTLSEQSFITVESKQLFERLVNLQPNFEKQLPGLKSEAKMAARIW